MQVGAVSTDIFVLCRDVGKGFFRYQYVLGVDNRRFLSMAAFDFTQKMSEISYEDKGRQRTRQICTETLDNFRGVRSEMMKRLVCLLKFWT